MKLLNPIIKCNRANHELKILYNTKIHKYYLLSCIPLILNVDYYPLTFTIDDLTTKHLSTIIQDYEDFVRGTKLSKYYSGFCTDTTFNNVSDKINCIYGDVHINNLRLDVGHKCNLHCKMCVAINQYNDTNEDEFAIKTLLQDIIDDDNLHMEQINSSEINEALAYDWYLDMVEMIPSNRVNEFIIHTNGLTLCRDRNRLNKFLDNIRFKRVSFNLSIDSIDSERFLDIRGIDFHKQLVELAQYLCKTDHLASIFYVCQKRNECEWDRVVQWFYDHGIGDHLLLSADRTYYSVRDNHEKLENFLKTSPVKI